MWSFWCRAGVCCAASFGCSCVGTGGAGVGAAVCCVATCAVVCCAGVAFIVLVFAVEHVWRSLCRRGVCCLVFVMGCAGVHRAGMRRGSCWCLSCFACGCGAWHSSYVMQGVAFVRAGAVFVRTVWHASGCYWLCVVLAFVVLCTGVIVRVLRSSCWYVPWVVLVFIVLCWHCVGATCIVCHAGVAFVRAGVAVVRAVRHSLGW